MNRQPIVAGLDESIEAAWAAGLGWRLARAKGVPFRLVHAAAPVTNDALLEGKPGTIAALVAERRDCARYSLTRTHAAVIPPEAFAQLEIRFGRPADVLADIIAENEAGLLVLGGKRHHALGRWFGGSTVHAAVHRRLAPVLMAVGAPYEKRRVLAALDRSAAASATLAGAREIASVFGAELRALHVIEPAPTRVLHAAATAPVPGAPGAERDLQALLRPAETLGIRTGPIAEEIAREATEWQADLVVLGSSGHGWLSRLVIGSVAEELLANPPASLLLVPPLAAKSFVAAPGQAAVYPALASA